MKLNNVKLFEEHSSDPKAELKKKLESKVTVNTYKGSDHFYFKKPILVGKVDGLDAYCTFFYSHYREYLVFAVVTPAKNTPAKKDLNNFNYINDIDMDNSKFEDERRDLIDGKFVPVTRVLDIDKDYLQKVYAATLDKTNIEFSKMYGELKDLQRKYLHELQVADKENDYDKYNPETYLRDFTKSLAIEEYHLMHDRYVNLAPDKKREAELEKRKKMTREEILAYSIEDKKQSIEMKKIFDDIFKDLKK